MTHDVHRRRLQAFAEELGNQDFAAAVVMERRDLFYLTGTAQPCNLLVMPGHEPVLFARRVLGWVKGEAAVFQVEEAADLGAAVRALHERGVRSGRVGLELDVVPAKLFLKARQTFDGFEIADCAPLLLRQRMIKGADEIEALRESARLFEVVHAAVMRCLRPGVTELELSGEIARAVRGRGHDGHVFYRRWDTCLQPEGIVASGQAATRISGHAMTVTGVGVGASLPWGASHKTIVVGDVVVVDLGLNKGGYHADMSRSYVVGEADDETRERFDVLLQCQDAAFRALRPGAKADDVYAAARAAADESGAGEFFQGFGDEQGNYIGHGIGLELDEPPVLGAGVATAIEVGMVLAVEPKLIGPWGAVQTEDDVAVTPSGPEILSTVPRQLFEVSGRRGRRVDANRLG